MRDQYAGDISDAIKFSLLRRLAGGGRRLGIAWYYVPGDDGRPDGRHLEWQGERAWEYLDPAIVQLHGLRQRSIEELERLSFWPPGTVFYREPVPGRFQRKGWAERKRHSLETADIVFLDPDNGLGNKTSKHATFEELKLMRRPGRALVIITFPGRSKPHVELVKDLHKRLGDEIGSDSIATLRTNISVPANAGSSVFVQRQRWLTVIDADRDLITRLQAFAIDLSKVPKLKAILDLSP